MQPAISGGLGSSVTVFDIGIDAWQVDACVRMF